MTPLDLYTDETRLYHGVRCLLNESLFNLND